MKQRNQRLLNHLPIVFLGGWLYQHDQGCKHFGKDPQPLGDPFTQEYPVRLGR